MILNPSSSNQTLASNIAYQPFGPVAGMTLGNNIALSKTFDLNYQIAGLLYTNGNALMHRSYTPDNVGNITDITDYLDAARSQSFAYSDLSMLTDASGLYGSITYTYDNVGNRYSKNIDGQNDSYYYSYNRSDKSYRLRSISGANPASFSYTPSGNTITKGSQAFEYNDNNRIVVSKQSGVELSQHSYSANGQRAKKDDGSSKVFHYNRSGQLIAETTTSGAMIKAYVWIHGQPLVQILPNDSVNYYHNDHLGTPQKMTDSSGTVVWSADYLPFGQADVTIETVENNLRFAGQYFDQETGLHYNYHRYYDPTLGRYLRADPIGLEGGVNLYAYVSNNPVNMIDPYGLVAGVDDLGALIVAGGALIIGGAYYATLPPDQQKTMANDVRSLWDWLWNENTEDGEDGGESCPTSPPDGLVENPDRPDSWGEYGEDSKFKERWRLDKGRPDIKRGHGSEDHIHLDGKKRWYPVKRK